MKQTPTIDSDGNPTHPGDKAAWSRFERAVDAAVKSGPQHKKSADQKAARAGVDKKARPASKGRVHKRKAST